MHILVSFSCLSLPCIIDTTDRSTVDTDQEEQKIKENLFTNDTSEVIGPKRSFVRRNILVLVLASTTCQVLSYRILVKDLSTQNMVQYQDVLADTTM
jgi:hypothetical protein